MIDKVTSAIRDAAAEFLYVAVNVCVEPVDDDGVTETGDAVPCVAVLAFEHPLSNRAQQRIKAKRTFELLSHGETRAREYCYVGSSNTNIGGILDPVIQTPETARHWNTTDGFAAVQRTADIKEQ
jgi:hypothetical protein